MRQLRSLVLVAALLAALASPAVASEPADLEKDFELPGIEQVLGWLAETVSAVWSSGESELPDYGPTIDPSGLPPSQADAGETENGGDDGLPEVGPVIDPHG